MRRFMSLNISLYHSRSLKVIQNDYLDKGISPYQYFIVINYVCISHYFRDIQC